MSFGVLNAAFGSDKPDLKVTKVTKNKPIQGQIDEAIGKSKDTFALSEDAAQNYLNRFNQNQPLYDAATGQALSTVGGLYDGTVQGNLGRLRADSMAAREGATQRALRMIEGRDRAYSAQMGLPGRSSYRDLMGARLTRDTMTDAALADAGQQRADYGYLLAQQLGNLGTQQGILQSAEGRTLQPLTAVAGARGIPMQNLSTLTNLDQANNFYGTYRKRGTLERLANAEQVGMDQLGQVVDMAGSVAGIAGMACWVARSVYGADDIRWKVFRAWLFTFAPHWFRYLYLCFGERFAAWLSKHPSLKPPIRRWMDGKVAIMVETFS